MHGAHTIKHWSNTQSTVALSSAEAELGGICRGASTGLGLQAIAKDLGLRWDLVVHTDASAAIGICKRRGLGKVRHLAVADLWVQDRIRKKDFEIRKIAGVDNPADLMTKNLDRPLMQKHMTKLGLVPEDGRASSAPTIEH